MVCEKVMAWVVEQPALRRLGVVVGRWPVRRSGLGEKSDWGGVGEEAVEDRPVVARTGGLE